MSDSRFDEVLLGLEEKSADELRSILRDLHETEQRISYQRRVLHGKMDILRAELVRRLRAHIESGEGAISGGDTERLIEILASDSRVVFPPDVAESPDNDGER